MEGKTVSESVPCKACGMLIRFVGTLKGKTMPIDAAGWDSGDWTIVKSITGKDIAVLWRLQRPSQGELIHLLAEFRQGKPYRFRCHFETCASPDRFRRKKP